MQRVMPQAGHDQQNWFEPIRFALERLAMCTRRYPTDAPLPEAEHEAAKVLRITLGNAALSTGIIVVGVARAVSGNAGPVAIAAGACVIGLLAYLQSVCAAPEVVRSLTHIPAFGSRRLRILRLAGMSIEAATITLLLAGSVGLLLKSVADLM